MKKNKEKQNIWLITIIGGTIAGLIVFIVSTILIALFKNIDFIKSLKFVLKSIFNFIIFIYTLKIHSWVTLLIIIITFLTLHILSRIKKSSSTKSPVWISYKKEFYKKWLFKWEYEKDNDGDYIINKLRPVCSNCECELNEKKIKDMTYYKNVLFCPNCEKTFPLVINDIIYDLEKLIIHRINNNEYLKIKYFESK